MEGEVVPEVHDFKEVVLLGREAPQKMLRGQQGQVRGGEGCRAVEGSGVPQRDGGGVGARAGRGKAAACDAGGDAPADGIAVRDRRDYDGERAGGGKHRVAPGRYAVGAGADDGAGGGVGGDCGGIGGRHVAVGGVGAGLLVGDE